MRVDEAGEHDATADIRDGGIGTGCGHRARGVADVDDALAVERDRLGPGTIRIGCEHTAAMEDFGHRATIFVRSSSNRAIAAPTASCSPVANRSRSRPRATATA